MTTDLNTLDKFKTNVKRFNMVLSALINKEYKNDREERGKLQSLLDAGSVFVDSMNPTMLIESFIENSSQYWTRIHHKDMVFFQENLADIFGQGSSITTVLQTVFNKLNKETEEHIWNWIIAFVKQSLTYLDECTPEYRNKFISEKKFKELYQSYHGTRK